MAGAALRRCDLWPSCPRARALFTLDVCKILLESPTRAACSNFNRYLIQGKEESRGGVFK